MTYREGYNRVWESFLTLRKVYYELEDLFLFLLHSRRFNLFGNSSVEELRRHELSRSQVSVESLQMMFDKVLHEIRDRKVPLSPAFLKLAQTQFHLLCNFSSGGTRAICGALFNLYSIDEEWFDDHYATLFDELLPNLYVGNSFSFRACSEPEELIQVVQRLCEGLGARSIYNPFAGTCSFSRLATDGVTYLGQESDERISSMGVLRLYAYGRDPYSAVCEDPTLNWGHGIHGFDLIVSFPPLGMRAPATEKMMIDWTARSIILEDFYILKGCESLNRGGKLIGIFPNSFLFRRGETDLVRKGLVDDCRVETVIQLPAGLLEYTGVAVSILILNDGSQKDGSVRFVDASSSFKNDGRRNRLLVDSVVQSVQSSDTRVSAEVSLEEIRAHDYHLVASTYLGYGAGEQIES